ncbi:MAG: NAD(P)/FAD-dependent oxidoreductase [Candidatus Obscuribacterales bacterium]|nr:NAD(P)/FAD-dependent oxidoreductase [Candidatus Obscuribacterales bacterium]
MSNSKSKVLILGGGFGGLYAALAFDKHLKTRSDIEVTVVNRDNFFLFTPMLHEVAASDLDLTNIVIPGRKVLKRVQYFTGDVINIDGPRKLVTVSHGFDSHSHEMPYDHLVLALGSVTNFFQLPGLEERALTMKTLGDAIKLRNLLIQHLEEADSECAATDREPLLTFVVAGGGFAGVETVAGINDFIRDALPNYRNLKEDMLRVVLVHPGEHILPELGIELGSYADEKLRERKVEIKERCRVASVDKNFVQISDGTQIQCKTLIWTAGTSPHPVLESVPAAKEKGLIRVNEFLEVLDCPGVWALGDCAAIPDLTTGKYCPATAQHASRQGTILASNILATISGTTMKPFKFATLGSLAAIGRRSGVAQILGLRFSGFIAWFLWRTIYLLKLPTLEKKVRVAWDWTLDLVFKKDFVQYLVTRAPAISQPDVDVNCLVRDECQG